MRKLVILRRSSQVFFFCLFVYILWSTTYPLEGLLPPETFFKANPLVMIFISLSERVVLPGLYFSLVMIILTIFFGRFFCGWVCPLGTSIDAIGALKKKKVAPDDGLNRRIRRIKYFVLGLIALFAVSGIQLAWVFDPMVIMARFVSLNLIPTATIAIDKVFVTAVKGLNFYAPLYDLYRAMKSSFLGVKIAYFANAGVILAVFLLIVLSSLLISRAWCRMMCPLGALYAFVSKFAVLRRFVESCKECGVCKANCRMGAIRDNMDYEKSECILCMDCIYDCPLHLTTFRIPRRHYTPMSYTGGSVSRRNFILLALSTIFLTGFRFRGRKGPSGKPYRGFIRPPGVSDEEKFLSRCIRCGNCMKVCITNGLQPLILEAGLESIWTPQLVPEIGYCEYNCNLCGNICPTGAIPELALSDKKKTKLGIARVRRSICIAWAEKKECIVCEEHCPIPTKAIKLEKEVVKGKTIYKPYVDPTLCVGCGICQNKCPVRPIRAIRVYA